MINLALCSSNLQKDTINILWSLTGLIPLLPPILGDPGTEVCAAEVRLLCKTDPGLGEWLGCTGGKSGIPAIPEIPEFDGRLLPK